MFCPNCQSDFIIGPEYTTSRAAALMTCLQCATRWDAYAISGAGAARRSKAA